MPSIPVLLETLREVLRALEALEARHMLVGGVALAAWAPPRATVDLDLAIAVPSADLPAVGAALAKRVGGMSSMRPFRFRDGTTIQRVVLQRPEGELTVDLILVRAADRFLTGALRRSVRSALGGLVDVHVATAEDLVVMKLRAGRVQDLADIRSLAGSQRLDMAYVRRWAARLKLKTRLTRALPGARCRPRPTPAVRRTYRAR